MGGRRLSSPRFLSNGWGPPQFHAFEPTAQIRWTNGNARLPASLFEGFEGPAELRLQIGGTTGYFDDGRNGTVGAAA